WLQRAQQAENSLAVAGTRFTEIQAGQSIQRIEERFWRQGARAQRIEILAPAARRGEVLLFRAGQWIAYRPGEKEAFELPRLPLQGAQLLQIAIDLVQAGLVEAEPMGEGVVLGRACVVVRLQLVRPPALKRQPPEKRAPFPASVSLWIDKETGLILRREVALHPNAPALRTEITRLELNPFLTPELFQLPADVVVRPLAGVYRTVEEAQRAVSFPIRVPSYLPAGAELERVMVQTRGRTRVVMLHYCTPTARFTLFQAYKSPHNSFALKKRPARRDAHFWQDGDYSFGIVGNLPKGEIDKIANSLSRASRN
ncbi:MAG: hypothetical protein NZ874_08120, partial [Fimbriimonadales bacterium]|nr:hypothetical protein [Fimbriimonadales bacterium]